MATQTELAALAINAYAPSNPNELKIPGWNEMETLSRQGDPSGFGASVFQGPDNEIVIAFRGTDDEPTANIDWITGNTAALGIYNSQVGLAIETVADVMAAHPGATIRLTGHSLGGGLASLMAVFFDLDATVFATAPFEATAGNLLTMTAYFEHYRSYQTDRGRVLDARFQSYIQSFAAGNFEAVFAQRELRVFARSIEGEILDFFRTTGNTVAGSTAEIDIGTTTLGDNPIDLHSIGLHACLVSDEGLVQASRANASLLELILDEGLYARDMHTNQLGFINRLLNDHLSGDGSSLLQSFSQDVLRLGTEGSTHINGLHEGILATIIERYYFASTDSTDEFIQTYGNGVRFDLSTIAGSDKRGQQRLLASIEEVAGTAEIARIRQWASGAAVWTVQRGANGLYTFGDDANEVQIGSMTTDNELRGGAGNDLLMNGNGGGTLDGGAGSDVLIGGTGTDLLYGGVAEGVDNNDSDYLEGGAGNDSLIGGRGNDELHGGSGDDNYNFFYGDGSDIVVDDSSGEGKIFIEGVQLTIGERIAENTWRSADGALTIERQAYGGHQAPSRYSLVIRDATGALNITIRDWQMGQLDIDLTFGSYPGAGETSGDIVPLAPQATDWRPVANPSGSGSVTSFLDYDNLVGSLADDRIFGLAGNDALLGREGDDYLDGGDGRDLLVGGAGRDTLIGGANGDVLIGDRHNVTLGYVIGSISGDVYLPATTAVEFNGLGWGVEHAGATAGPITAYLLHGVSTEYVAGDADFIDAGAGDDYVLSGDGDDVVDGGDDNDQIVAEAGDDNVQGGAGNDIIIGDGQRSDVDPEIVLIYSPITQQGRDVLHGGDGDDYIAGGGNADRLYGDEGNDQLYGDEVDGFTVSPSEQADDLLDGGGGNDFLTGQGGNDTLYGGDGADTLRGDADDLAGQYHGNDLLSGDAGNDGLKGGGGADQLFGGSGNDTLFGDADTTELDSAYQGSDYLDGGDDDDILVGGGGADYLYGGSGRDRLFGDQGTAGLAGASQGADNLDGGAGEDELIGGGGDDTLLGGEGADRIDGDDIDERAPVASHGNDYIDAGSGDDIVFGWGGSDIILGGDGADQLVGDQASLAAQYHGSDYINGGAGNDTLWGLGGSDQLYGGDGSDTLDGDDGSDPSLAGNDYLDGGTGDDTLYGRGGNDVLLGSVGNDNLSGGDGDDQLNGGEGDDVILGGNGNDVISGGLGNDNLQGGAGDDTYVFDQEDLTVTNNTADSIFDLQGDNQIIFRSGVSEFDIVLSAGTLSGSVEIRPGARLGLVVRDALSGSVSTFRFSNGTVTSANRLIGAHYDATVNVADAADAAHLLGGLQNDTIAATGDGATISGGRGNDALAGGTGSTTYVYESGDGFDTISDQSTFIASSGKDRNTLQLGAGVALSDLTLATTAGGAQLTLEVGDSGSMQLSSFAPTDVLNGVRTLDEIRFSTGASYSWQELVAARGIEIRNESGVVSYSGTNVGDRIVGASVGETIDAGDGDDLLDGRQGNDVLSGGPGSDTYLFGRGYGADTINNADAAAGKIDSLKIADDIAADDIDLFRVGADLFVYLRNSPEYTLVTNYFTTAGLDQIRFGDGTVWTQADVLSRAVVTEVDAFTGTSGNDTFVVDNLFDTVTEAVNSGIDTILASVSYFLPNNVENLTLTGSLSINATGNSLNNVLTGNAGNNVFVANGGQDTLTGGAGDDTYVLGATAASCVIVEAANEGIDLVQSSATYTLGANLENLTLTGNAAVSVTGNALSNVLRGNSASNTLDGGLGADVLAGDDGSDTYIVDDAGDVVIENSNAGSDVIKSYVTYTLPENVESLILLGNSSINGTGNDSDNSLDGSLNSAVNVLAGGAGSDSYSVDASDIVIENPGGGSSDSVSIKSGSATTYDLIDDYANVESIYIHDAVSGATLVGNSDDNTITGNRYSNTLVGGAGNDLLLGGHFFGYPGVRPMDQEYFQIYDSGSTDVFNGGVGNDVIAGGYRNTILFARGDGQDEIWLTGAASSYNDWIELTDSSITAADVLVSNQGGANLVLNFVGGSDQITVYSHFYSRLYGPLPYNGSIDGIRFADGTVWTESDIYNRLLNSTNVATEGDDTLTGTSAADTLNGLDGNDNISGGAGDDILDGGDAEDVLFGNAGNDTLIGGGGDDSLYGHDGNDTLHGDDGDDSLSAGAGEDVLYGEADSDNLHAGAGNDSVYGGSGDDWIFGEGGQNTLDGGEGDDFITGGDEQDLLDGGAGNDRLSGGHGSDTYRFYRNGGSDILDEDGASSSDIDTVEVTGGIMPSEIAVRRSGYDLVLTLVGTSDSLTVASFFDALGYASRIDRVHFEDGTVWNASMLELMASTITGTEGPETLNGSIGNDGIYGLGGNDTLNGNDGDDLLDGGAGNDIMRGELGNDTYVVDNASDTVTESANQGTDTVQSLATWTLGTNVENLLLLGSANINGTGNSLANVITGNSGNNTLSGGGGADTLIGRASNDSYIVDNVGDIVIEDQNEGLDAIQSAVTFTLADNVEDLTLTGSAAINGAGNALDNVLTGNSGNNSLVGGAGNDTLHGGSGSDAMSGGQGNDTFVVAQTGDVVTENAAEGIDLVQSSIAYTLGNNIENLTLTGSSTINGTGNALDNILVGNTANNTLMGLAGSDTIDGGAGTDTMVGGLGDDIYFVDASTDVTTENSNEGIDRVNSSVTRTLAANIELLFLTGTSATNATGNSLSNLLRGNAANNTLAGAAGIDILEGGAGSDALSNTTSKSLLNGGADADTLTGTAVNDLLIGGAGNDALTTGQGADTIVFNKGDGQDTVAVSTTRDNTLSLGGAVYADLLFRKNGNDLILQVGATDQITFTGYYASSSNRSVNNLQVVIEGTSEYDAASANAMRNKKIETFNFEGLVAAFDAARAANPSLTTWALTNALLTQHLSASDAAALGGDLAYRYGRFGTLSDISYTPAVGILSASGFGTSAQALQSLSSLQDASVRLS